MSVDAIVLLGCRIRSGGEPSAAAARRARAAARAWHDRVAPWVIASGGRRWSGISEAEALKNELVRLGVDPAAIALELCSLSTFENARYTARLLQRRGLSRVAVVTCDWHLPRALVSFQAAGVDCVGIPAPAPESSLWVRWKRRASERVSGLLDRVANRGGDARS